MILSIFSNLSNQASALLEQNSGVSQNWLNASLLLTELNSVRLVDSAAVANL